MNQATTHAVGTFCWPELATSDAEGALKFYSELFNWDVNEMPIEGGGSYYMWQLKGLDLGAMYQLNADQQQASVPPHWMGYIAVENIEATLDKIAQADGKVVMGPMDVGEAGRMAVISDPQGAVFALWQAIGHLGAQVLNEPGSMCWNELATTDSQAAAEFYGQVFGWTAQTKQASMGPYTRFLAEETMAAGMMQMTEEWGEIPPHWMIYFAVKDTNAHCDKVKALGGKVCVEPFDIPEVGRLAVINDPQGAVFSIIDLISPEPEGN